MGVGFASDAIPFTIQNRNLDRLSVLLTRTMTINGRVPLDGIVPAGMRVQLVRALSALDQRLEGIVERDGSFAIQNVGPGAFDVFIDPLPGTAYLNSVRFQQQDGLRGPIFFEPGTVTTPARGGRGGNLGTRLDLQLSWSGVAAEGAAVDAAGRPVPGAEVVLIPVTYRNREDRYLRTLADPAGNFRLTGIPPGTYTLIAFEDIEPGAYYAFSYDAGLSTRYVSRGQRLDFAAGTDRQQLRITAIPAFETAGGLR
jgi:hypothetical protein